MNDDCVGSRPRQRSGMDKPGSVAQYTTKDFQLEDLGKLVEMQSLTESLEGSRGKKLEAVREQRRLKFDCRTLIALRAMILSFCGAT
jgi:hypothetical protein